jgi:hypothetical protein
LLLAETKASEKMDTSSKEQRTYEESERERVGREMEKAKRWKLEKSELGKSETGNWKLEVKILKKGRRKRTRKKK